MRESIEAMKKIWTKEAAEYHGEFVNFDPMIARPKPAQKPYPPLHVGGAFPYGVRRVIRYGDGWIPAARGDVAEVLPKFHEMAREAGSDPTSIEITSFGLERISTEQSASLTWKWPALWRRFRPRRRMRCCRLSTGGPGSCGKSTAKSLKSKARSPTPPLLDLV